MSIFSVICHLALLVRPGLGSRWWSVCVSLQLLRPVCLFSVYLSFPSLVTIPVCSSVPSGALDTGPGTFLRDKLPTVFRCRETAAAAANKQAVAWMRR